MVHKYINTIEDSIGFDTIENRAIGANKPVLNFRYITLALAFKQILPYEDIWYPHRQAGTIAHN